MAKFVLTAQLQLMAPRNVGTVVRQIQNQLNNVHVNVAVQGGAAATKNLQNINRQTQAVTSSAQRMGKAFAVSIKRFAAFSIATRAIGLLTHGLGGAVAEAIEFEREMVKVAQVTNQTMQSLKGLTNEITRLSTEFGVSSKSILSTARILSQAGLSAAETKVALDALAKSELAPTFENITQTAEGAVAIFNQFGQGAEALEAQLGAINAVAGKFAVEAGDLISVIRRTGGVFKAAGGDLNELIALFTSVRATTRESAESIATGLRTIFTRIQRPRTIEFLKQFGVSLVDLNGKFVGPFEAVKRLSNALSGLEQGDITFIRIAEELGGFRQIGKVIPLLQQFGTAQEALGVAMAGQGSLAEDAAKAQESLAVRIVKVKEEFMALIRTITESATFQVMANTALALASAFIKVADAVAPLLPLLTALMAIKITRGLASFAGGLRGGMKGFNKGGLVPGSGNRDTVPALLTPGEFVIRKSSVGAIGADNLASMNRYAAGGKVNAGRHAYGPPAPAGARAGIANFGGKGKGIGKTNLSKGTARVGFQVLPGQIGGFVLQPAKGTDENYKATKPFQFKLPAKNPIAASILKSQGLTPAQMPHLPAQINPAMYPLFYPGKAEGRMNLKKAGQYQAAAARGSASAVQAGLERTVKVVQSQGLLDFPPAINSNETFMNEALDDMMRDKGIRATIEGYLFEGMITALTGAKAGGQKANFDFPATSIAPHKPKLQALFGPLGNLRKAEAKRSRPEIVGALQRKLANDVIAGRNVGVKVQRLAKGGPVGTDTVPALLTPGEFVVNKKSAQSIGYGNLASMNRYAAGGKVSQGRHAYGAMGGVGVSFKGMDNSAAGMMQKTESLGKSLMKLGATTEQSNKIQGRFANALANGATNSQALATAFKGVTVGGKQLVANKRSEAAASKAAAAADNLEAKSSKGAAGAMGGLGGNLMMLTMFTQGLGDAETAGGRLTNSLSETAMQLGMVIMALEMFGVKLTAQTFFGGGGMGGKLSKGLGRKGAMMGPQRLGMGGNFMRGIKGKAIAPGSGALGRGAGLAGRAGTGLGKFGAAAKSAAGPLLAVTAGFWAVTKAIDAFNDYQGKANKAIEEGNAAAAEEMSAKAALASSSNTAGYAMIAAGAAIGSVVPGVGTFVGAVAGAALALTTKLNPAMAEAVHGWMAWMGIVDELDTIKAEAKFRAQNVKAMKQNKKAQEEVTKAMEDLEAGTTTALEAMNRAEIAQNFAAANEANITAQKLNGHLETQKSFGMLRDFISMITFGLVESNEQRNQGLQDRIDKNRETQKATDKAAIKSADPLMQQVLKQQALQIAGAGGSADPEKIGQGNAREQILERLRASGEGGEEAAKLLERSPDAMNNYIRSLNNMVEEQKKFIAYLEAMNLGMRDVTAVSAATALNMDNLMNSFSVGFIPLENSIRTVEAAMTSAGSKISAAEFGSAIEDVEDTLRHFGATDKEIDKFTESAKGVHHLQKNFKNLFNKDFKDRLSTGDIGQDPNALKGELEKIMIEDLEKAGFGPETVKQFKHMFQGIDVKDLDIEAIMAGDFESITGMFEGLGEEATKRMIEIAEKRIEIEKKLMEVTKEKIAAEQRHVAALKSAVSMRMEAAEISAKHGGRAFDNSARRAMLIERANVGMGRLGVGAMTSGSVSELRRRNQSIGNRFAGIEMNRRTEGGMAGRAGMEDDAAQKDLMKANKDHAKLIRDLIKLEEDELKIIQKKNELEKQSLEALAKGDLEGFLKQQAAVGATAAVATGDQRLMNLFGADAISGAFENIKKQQESGVQSLFGRRLAGAGGLTEAAAGAALGSRGLNDLRSAQVMAGTTPAEEAQRRKIRGLAGELAATGQMGADMAGMQVNTANIKIEKATIEADRLASQARAEADKQNQIDQQAVQHPARGGLIGNGVLYRALGGSIFKPKGTDTVPAMLTPGEFVVNRAAVNRGNNLRMLRAMNSGAGSDGGADGYYHKGGKVRRRGGSVGLNPEVVNQLSSSLMQFNTSMAANIKALQELKFQIKLDTTNVNVNLNGTSFLAQLKDGLKEELLAEVSRNIKDMNFTMAGDPTENSSVLNTA